MTQTYLPLMFAKQTQIKTNKKPKEVKKSNGEKFVKDAKVKADNTSYNAFDMKRFWIIVGVTTGIFIVLFVLSCTIDFDVSWGLASSKYDIPQTTEQLPTMSYYSNNAWDNLMEAFGDAPAMFMCAFGCWLLAFGFFKLDKDKANPFRRVVQVVLPSFFIVSALWAIYYYNTNMGFHDYLKILGGDNKDELTIFTSALLSIVFNGVFMIVIFRFRQTTKINLVKLGVLFIFAYVISEIFIWVLKFEADLNRERFRAIAVDNTNWMYDPSQQMWVLNKDSMESWFHNWWQKTPESFKDIWLDHVVGTNFGKNVTNAFSSFPSGHSSLATCCMALCFLPCCYDKARNKEWKGYLIWLITLGVSLTVMFSRVSAGAHYLSDVTIGFFFGAVPILIMGLLMFKVPAVTKFCQGMNINGKWYEFTIVPIVATVMIWIITWVMPWA